MLNQHDIVERRHHEDAVGHGGWSIDLHPADGVFAKIAGSHHLHSKGPYQIPYRCYYSRNIRNLFLTGRIMSSSHVAFGSTRVMGTCSVGGQAVAIAASICKADNCLPADIAKDPAKIKRLQRDLMRAGQYIPGAKLEDGENLASRARVSATSSMQLGEFAADGGTQSLEDADWAQMLPVGAGKVPAITLTLDVKEATEAVFELRTTSRPDHHTPDVTLAKLPVKLEPGEKVEVRLEFPVTLPEAAMVFVVAPKSAALALHGSRRLVSGMMWLRHGWNEKTSQVGGEDYEVFAPRRRPQSQNAALRIEPPLAVFGPENVTNGTVRPTHQANAWVADAKDAAPALTLQWEKPQRIGRVELFFDVDFDHGMESVLFGHPENVMPFCVKRYRITDGNGTFLHECAENHVQRNVIRFEKPVETARLVVEVLEMNSAVVPATVVEVRCYE